MAKKPLKGNYLTLEDVRITYDENTDSIHLTSKDKDLPPGGFHLTLNKGRDAEHALRSLLINAGMAKPKEEDTIPQSVPEFPADHPHKGFALGKGARGKVIYWEPDYSPHMFISGGTGRGKSVFLRNLIYAGLISRTANALHILDTPLWEFHVVDLKSASVGVDDNRGDLQAYLKYNEVLKGMTYSIEGTEKLLQDAHDEMERRYELMKQEGKVHYRYLNERLPGRVIVIDEAYLLFEEQRRNESIKDYLQRQKIVMLIHEISRKSKAAGIHLVLTSQDPGLLFGELEGNFSTKIAIGKHNKQASYSLLKNHEAALISDKTNGRCYIKTRDQGEEFQMFITKTKPGQDIEPLVKQLYKATKKVEKG